MVDVCITLDYGSIYGEDNVNLESLIKMLSMLNRDETLKRCSEVNILLFDYNGNNLQKDLIRKLFPKCPSEIYNTIQTDDKIIFYRGQILRMLQHVIQYCSVSNGLRIVQNGYDELFLKAALLINSLETIKQTQDTLDWRIEAMPILRQGREYSNHIDIHSCEHFQIFYRGYSIFVKHFSCEYKEKFLNIFGISLYNTYVILMAFVMHMLQNFKQGIFNYKSLGSKTKINKEINKFIERLSTTPEKIREELFKVSNKSHTRFIAEKCFRNNPIIRFEDGTASIMDASFLLDFVARGPLFFLARDPSVKANEVFSHYGKPCFERYVSEHVKRIVREKEPKFSEFLLDGNLPKGKNELEYDCLIDFDDEIVLAEIKAYFITDSSSLQEEIDKKYDFAIEQFIRRIIILSKRPNVKMIYPILIVDDARLDISEFYLREKLEKQISLKKLNNNIRHNLQIQPLVIMSINNLEYLPSLNDFRKLILDYLDFSKNYSNYLLSFTDFIRGDHHDHKLTILEEVLDKMIDLLNDGKTMLFHDGLGSE
jgi:hypothetical protein